MTERDEHGRHTRPGEDEPPAGSGTTGGDEPAKRQAGAYARDAEQDPGTPPDESSAEAAR
jgi:hypothetical protein